MDKKKTNKKKISTLVRQQVPEYVLSDHPKFTEFLSSYFLFMESAELNLDTFTDIDQILLETVGTTASHVLLEQTDKNGLDAGDKIVQEENTFGGSFQKGETITGATSGATSTVLTDDIKTNSRLFISANNAFITGETVTGGTSGATAKITKYRANPVENLQQLLNYTDPDHTISDFLSQMKEEFLSTIPDDKDSSVDTRKLIKNIKSLYRSKGTDKAHKAFFKILFNEPSEVYKPTEDMLRVSDGKFSKQNFIRCTQTTTQSVNDPIYLVGQTITQANDPSSTTINAASAVVENITKFREGSVEIIEIEINAETTSGTFINGETLTGISNIDEEIEIKLTISQGLSGTTITNDGSTLTVGDEATLSGGGGAGGRVQVQDISGAGVDEVIVNAAGTGYEIGDTLTFSSGTAEAKVSIVNGGFAPETGSVDIHVELETGTITGSGSGDLLLEDIADGTVGKFLDSASQMIEKEVKIELENEVGHLLNETDGGSETSQIDYIVNQEHEIDIPYGIEDTDHIVLEAETQDDGLYPGDKIVQENSTGSGDLTDIRMIASGSGYTTLPTATISGDRYIGLEGKATQTTRHALFPVQERDVNAVIVLETGGRILNETAADQFTTIDGDSSGAGRIELETGGRLLSDIAFDGANGTVIPFGADIGRATSLNIIEHGINYTSAPSFAFPHYAVLKTISDTISADETFTSNVSGATGTVVDVTAPLLKYTATTSSLAVGDTVTFSGGETAIVAKSDPLTGTGTIGTNIFTDGKYINQDGHISEGSKKIQDSLYYQDYSYVIKVSESINKWRDSIKKAVHPSGFYVTGEVNIQTRLAGGIRQPVGATLSQGLFSGTSDSPIYMRLNTLFSTIFGRRTGAALSSTFGGTQLDGLTKRTRAAANAGYSVDVSNEFTSSHYNARQVDVNLTPETTIEMEQRNRNSFYSLNSNPFTLEDDTGFIAAEDVGNIVDESGYTVKGVGVSNGFAYAGPRMRNLKTYAFTTFAANNAITLEGGTGAGEIRLENESGVLQHPQSDSFGTTIENWNSLRFTGTLNTNVDGESFTLADIDGVNTNLNHKTNFAFPTEVTKSA